VGYQDESDPAVMANKIKAAAEHASTRSSSIGIIITTGPF